MIENINKIWGERRRLLLTKQTEIDLLYLKANTFCSTHTHIAKLNKFTVIKGEVVIETSLGKTTLKKNESWTVIAPLEHRFVAIKDSIMIEMAYVKKGIIDKNDIVRKSLGGRIINNKEVTI